ncbi:MAG: hypothetical protein K2N60_09140 [Oscillospiraceae bacterium]|nr:hypothetical protein [Oscillospiraceae bacterium]
MNIKRTVGTGKIFLYSCGAVLALAGVVWLIINGVYAVLISGEEPRWTWFHSYTKSSADIITPWLLMAASMAICYRYMKMCRANNVSCTKQAAVFSLLSIFISTLFAAADLLTAKLVLQPLYGGIVITRLEDESSYFWYIITDYMDLFEEDVPQTLSPYTMNTLLMIFAFMAVYYYCFFLAGCYIMQCFRCGRKKTLIYYAVTAAVGILLMLFISETGGIKLENTTASFILNFPFIVWLTLGFLTNPIVFLYFIPYVADGDRDIDSIVFSFVMMTIFILITVGSTESLGLKQFPSKRKIKKALKSYNAQNQNNYGEGGTSQ